MSMNDSLKVLLFSINPVGTNVCIPTEFNAIPCRTLSYAYKPNSVERTLVKPYFGNNPKAIVGEYAEIQVEFELTGGQNNGIAAAGYAPYWEDVLLCAGATVTTTAFNISAEVQSGTTQLVGFADSASTVDGTYDGWTAIFTLSSETARNQTSASGNKVYLADTKVLNETKTQTSASTTAIKLSADASSSNNAYVGDILVIAGERRVIDAYVGSTRIATVAALSAIPASGTPYSIIHTSVVRTGFATGAGSTLTSIVLDAGASVTNNIYNGNIIIVGNHQAIITAYNGFTKAVAISPPLSVAPVVGTSYVINAESIISTLKCDSSSTTTAIVLSASASAVNGFYNGMLLTIGNTSKVITNYVGATRTATVGDAFGSAPSSGTAYTITATAEVERANIIGSGSTTSLIKLDSLASSEIQHYAGMRLLVNGETVVIDDYDSTANTATVIPALSNAPQAGDSYVIFYNDDHYSGLPLTVRHFSGSVISNTGNQKTTSSKVYLPDLVVGDIELYGLDLSVTHAGVTEKRRIYRTDKKSDYVAVTPAFSFKPDNGDYFEISEAVSIINFDGINKIATVNKNLRIYPKSNSAYQIGFESTVVSYDGTAQKAVVTPQLPIAPPAGSLYTLVANRTYNLKTFSRTSPLRTGTAYFVVDSALHSLTNALVTVSFELASGNIPVIKATITGLFGLYENSDMPNFNRGDYIEALPVNEANTRTIYLNGYEDAVMEKFSIDVANKIEYRNMPNFEGIVCNNRAPKGSFNIEATDAQTLDWFSTIRKEDKGPVIISHGVTNNRATFVMPNAQFDNHGYGNNQSVVMNSLDIIPLPLVGNDEFKLVIS